MEAIAWVVMVLCMGGTVVAVLFRRRIPAPLLIGWAIVALAGVIWASTYQLGPIFVTVMLGFMVVAWIARDWDDRRMKAGRPGTR